MWKRVIWLLPLIFMIIYVFLPKDDRFFINFDGTNMSDKAFFGESFVDFQKQHPQNLNLALYEVMRDKIPLTKADIDIILSLKKFQWNAADLKREQKFYQGISDLESLAQHKYEVAAQLVEILKFKEHRFSFYLPVEKKIDMPEVDSDLWQGDKKLFRKFLLVTHKGQDTEFFQEFYYRIRSFIAPYARTAWLQTDNEVLLPKEQKFYLYSDYALYPGLDVDMAQVRLFLIDAYVESLKVITKSR